MQRSIWQNCRSGCHADADGLDRVLRGRQHLHAAQHACLHLPTERLLRMHQEPTSREYKGAIVPFCSSCVASDRSGRYSVLRNGETAAQSNAYRRSRSAAWCRLLVLGVTLSLGRRASHAAWLFHAVPRRSEAGADYAGSARCLLTLLAAADTMRLVSFGFQPLIVRTEAGASTLN